MDNISIRYGILALATSLLGCGTTSNQHDAKYQAAVEHHSRGNISGARQGYDELIATGDQRPELHNNRGVLSLQEGDLADALKRLKIAQSNKDSSDAVHVNALYARALDRQQRPDALRRARVLIKDPTSSERLRRAAALVLATSTPDAVQARETIQELLRNTAPPGDADLHFALGVIAMHGEQFGPAAEAFAHSAATKRNPWAHYNRALALRALGRQAEAMDELVAAKVLAPNERPIARLQAHIAIESGQWSQAHAALAPLLKRPSPRAVDFELLGRTLLGEGLPKEAAVAFEDCVRTDKSWTVGWYNLGLSRIRLRQWQAARRSFEQVIALDSGDLKARQQLDHVRRVQRLGPGETP